MKSVKTLNFEADIVQETSMQAKATDLGKAKCSMELFTATGDVPANGNGLIEWYLEYLDENGELDGDDDVEHIGISFANKTLTDYDGLFSLPSQAVELIRSVGIIVPEEFISGGDVQEVTA